MAVKFDVFKGKLVFYDLDTDDIPNNSDIEGDSLTDVLNTLNFKAYNCITCSIFYSIYDSL
jgi:hypothetical protein